MRPSAFVNTNRGRVVRRLEGMGAPIVLIVGGISVIGGRRILAFVSTCHGRYSFTRVIPMSTEENSGASRLMGMVVGCLPCKPRFCSRSAVASRPRHRVMTRVVHRGTLRDLGRRVPRKVTMTVSRVGVGRGIYRVSTAVVYRESSRGKVVVKGRKDVLGGVKDATEFRVRHLLSYGMGLGL